MKKIILLATLTLLAACTEKEPLEPGSTSRNKPHVVSSNYPLYFFARKIAADSMSVHFPEIAGDPAMWAPTGSEAAELQNADLLILNGAGYESWLAFTTLPAGHTLDTTTQVREKLLPIENETVHQHGPAGEHSHGGTAFTTWLDPQLAIEQARAIYLGLSGLEPKHSDLFKGNFDQLEKKLNQLDQSLKTAFAPLGGQPVIFSHPVYQYLEHRYGINGHSMHWEPDTDPGTREWINFGNLLRRNPASIMVWEDAPLDSVREKLLEMGVHVVVFRPAGNTPVKGDYFSVMEQNILELESYSGQTRNHTEPEAGIQ